MTTIYLPETVLNIEHEISWITTGSPAAVPVRENVWWNHYWPYRRRLKIEAPPIGLEKNHPITVYVPKKIETQGKVRSDLADVEVVYLVSNFPERWKVIPSEITSLETNYRVRFNLVDAIHDPATPNEDSLISEGEYFIYYGNKDLRQRPLVATYEYDEYPIEAMSDSGHFTYTDKETNWSNNVSLLKGAKANLTFYGEQIKLYAVTGAHWGRALVTVTNTADVSRQILGTNLYTDATPSDRFSYVVDLQKFEDDAEEMVLNITGLPDGIHHLIIEDIGSPLPNTENHRINFTKAEYKKHAIAEDLYEEADNAMNWATGMGGGL